MASCLYAELVTFLTNLAQLEKLPTLSFFRRNMRYNKIKTYEKIYFNLFKKEFLDQNRAKIKDSFNSIYEFLFKSLDTDAVLRSQGMNILLHLNRLIAFSLEDVLSAGLRGVGQPPKDNISNNMFESLNLNLRWDPSVISLNFCLLDIIRHFILISSLRPLRAYNIQTAFSWAWVLEKVCYKNQILNLLRILPILHWTFNFLVENSLKLRKLEVDFVGTMEIIEKEVLYLYNKNLLAIIDDLSLPFQLQQILNKRQQKGLMFIIKNECITRKMYADHLKISFMTAYRDLNYMVNRGILERKGYSNKTYYCFKESTSRAS